MGNRWVTVDHVMNDWVITVDHWRILMLVNDWSNIVKCGFEMNYYWPTIVSLHQDFWWVTVGVGDVSSSSQRYWVLRRAAVAYWGLEDWFPCRCFGLCWLLKGCHLQTVTMFLVSLSYHVAVDAIYCHHQQMSFFVCGEVVGCFISIHKPGPD